jgi:hypothetical protein
MLYFELESSFCCFLTINGLIEFSCLFDSEVVSKIESILFFDIIKITDLNHAGTTSQIRLSHLHLIYYYENHQKNFTPSNLRYLLLMSSIDLKLGRAWNEISQLLGSLRMPFITGSTTLVRVLLL